MSCTALIASEPAHALYLHIPSAPPVSLALGSTEEYLRPYTAQQLLVAYVSVSQWVRRTRSLFYVLSVLVGTKYLEIDRSSPASNHLFELSALIKPHAAGLAPESVI